MADWFRSWHGAPTDPKWLVVSRNAGVAFHCVTSVAWALMDHASQNNPRGYVADFDSETYSALSGMDEKDVEKIIEAMSEKGIINDEGHLSAWEKRQPNREDTSTDRVRKYREKKKREANAAKRDETQCNADETLGNAPDTDTDTDLKPSGSSAAPTNPYPDDFEALWSIYPKRDGSNPKKAAFSAYRARLKEGADPEAIRAGVERYAVWCESRGKVGTETVMQTKRFFGPGKEWENPWPVAFQPVKLPRDTSAHWRARRAVELPEDFTDFDASLAEINNRLRERPDLRGGLE